MDQLKNYYKEMGVDEKVFDYAQEVEKGLKDRFETLDAKLNATRNIVDGTHALGLALSESPCNFRKTTMHRKNTGSHRKED